MKVTARANLKNRFDIECRDIVTGEVQKFQAHNIVLNQMWSRLVNFQTFFANIHYGTGAGTLDPTRTSLFTHLGTKTATDVAAVRALPTSHRQRQIVLNPEEHVGAVITEVGVAFGAATTNLVTHAFLEDSEGNPISITKTDTMVVTIYATIFFELGELTDMYSGKWRWVQPLANNELLSYLLGATYPTQQFRVTRAPEFSNGTAPGSHGSSANILVADWIKDAANKKVTTPVRRLGVSVGNGEVRGFGLGSSDTNGVFRGQFPIPGVFTGKAITENIGSGDGSKIGFNLLWNDPASLVVKVDEVPVSNYDALPVKKGTNLFLFRNPVILVNATGLEPSKLTDGDIGTGSFSWLQSGASIGIDVGENRAGISVNKLNVYADAAATIQLQIRGSNNPDYSSSTLLGTMTSVVFGWSEISFAAAAYRYYVLTMVSTNQSARQYREIQLLTADDQITFHTPPAEGVVITADYSLDYVPKDSNHVLDLQCAIQYGEG